MDADDDVARSASGASAAPGEGSREGEAGALRAPLRPEVLRERLLWPAGPVDRLEVVERAGSTNTDLADALRRDPGGWGHVGVLVTEHQVDGRGRSGRTWQTPPAAALTFSVALRPPSHPETLGWLPLLAGLAVVRAIRSRSGLAVTVKWPNDLMVDVPGADDLPGWGTERKVGGILAELVPAGPGPVAVVGIGVNVSQSARELPVPSALSLAGALGGPGDADGVAGGLGDADGGPAHPDPLDRDELLVAIVRELTGLVDRWRASDGDAAASGLADDVAAVCATLGRPVRVELPGDRVLAGTAVGLGPDGALLVRDPAGEVVAVRAGDVRHVRAVEAG